MDKRTVFLYWVGKDFKLIKTLRDLIYLHADNVILINEQNLGDYVKTLPDCFKDLCPAHQADFVRVSVVCEYGGIWLDADTLVVDTLDSLFERIEKKDGFLIKFDNDGRSSFYNGVFGSKKQTPLMIKWKSKMLEILEQKRQNIAWAEIGTYLLDDLDPSFFNNYEVFDGTKNMFPIRWQDCVAEFIDKPYDNYKSIIREYQPLISLVNSVYRSVEDEGVRSDMPISYFITKSIENATQCTQLSLLS
jgi:hypothetical protein